MRWYDACDLNGREKRARRTRGHRPGDTGSPPEVRYRQGARCGVVLAGRLSDPLPRIPTRPRLAVEVRRRATAPGRCSPKSRMAVGRFAVGLGDRPGPCRRHGVPGGWLGVRPAGGRHPVWRIAAAGIRDDRADAAAECLNETMTRREGPNYTVFICHEYRDTRTSCL